jgi:hypothetical protein
MKAVVKDIIREVLFCEPAGIYVRFDDDLEKTIPIADLGLSPKIRWETLELSPNGESITVDIPSGERVPIEAANLRYFADNDYAAAMELAFDELLGDDDGPPPGFFYHPAQTPRY